MAALKTKPNRERNRRRRARRKELAGCLLWGGRGKHDAQWDNPKCLN
jgi:hypothetical protein